MENNVLSTFAWQTGVNYAGLAPIAGTTNYVELLAGAAGTTTLIEVTETSPSVSCDADPVYFGFTAIAEPTVAITNATSTVFGLNNVIVSACEGDPALAVAITATLAPAQESNWYINMPYTVYNVAALDGSGNIVLPGTNITATSTVDVFGADGTNVPSATNPLIAAASPIVGSQTYAVQNNQITVYQFTYNNVNANISRISDYIARRAGTLTGTYGFSYYPAAAANTNYYIVALPTPVTGPIYHIANNFAY